MPRYVIERDLPAGLTDAEIEDAVRRAIAVNAAQPGLRWLHSNLTVDRRSGRAEEKLRAHDVGKVRGHQSRAGDFEEAAAREAGAERQSSAARARFAFGKLVLLRHRRPQ